MSTTLVNPIPVARPLSPVESDFVIRTATAEHVEGIAEIISSPHILDGTMRVPFEPLDAIHERVAQRQ